MELEITQEKENGLFNRKEIQGLISAEVAPRREDVLKILAEKFSVPQETIKIKGIHGKFGLQEFKLEANIYKSKEDKDQLEVKKKKEIENVILENAENPDEITRRISEITGFQIHIS